MFLKNTGLDDAFIIDIERLDDNRGFFARSWCQQEFKAYGLNPRVVQCNISFNSKRGTLRGMHFQEKPYEEAKLVRCTMGSIYDVIVDLRPGSPSFKKHTGIELTSENRRMLYVPEGFAHGFLTLEDSTEVFYMMTEFYSPEHSRGFRWDDPSFEIEWPSAVEVISDCDRNYQNFRFT